MKNIATRSPLMHEHYYSQHDLPSPPSESWISLDSLISIWGLAPDGASEPTQPHTLAWAEYIKMHFPNLMNGIYNLYLKQQELDTRKPIDANLLLDFLNYASERHVVLRNVRISLEHKKITCLLCLPRAMDALSKVPVIADPERISLDF